MISFRPWLTCLTSKSAFLCCLLLALVGSPADVSAKWNWKDVSADEAVLKLKNWPGAEQCRMRKAMAPNYSRENTVFYCPRWVGDDEPRTYLRVQELMPGYYWAGNYSTDFSEHPIFTKLKGNWFKYFKNPVIKPGQRTKCYNDNGCSFQRIEFSVKGRECQWIIFNPSLGTTDSSSGLSDTPYGLEIFTCQTSVPITKEHIEMKPGKVTVTFSGTRTSSPPAKKDQNTGSTTSGMRDKSKTDLCVGALAPGLMGWSKWNLPWKEEAQRRDLSVADCQNELGVAAKPTSTAFPATTPLSPSKSVDVTPVKRPVQNDRQKRSIAVQWEGKESLISGYVNLSRKKSGKINFTLPDSEGQCSGMFAYSSGKKGVWSAACTTGETASGSFKALGAGKGSTGTGKDNEGRTVRFTIGAK